MRIPEAPLFNDPIYNGAADPVIFWNRDEQQWWIVYTQRMHSAPGPGTTPIHGSKLGVASSPDGHDWLYRGTLTGLEFEHGHNTWWAPEIFWHEDRYHMYASYVQGMPVNWNRPRTIIHYTSTNGWEWKLESKLKLSSDRVIDACVTKMPSGIWRMWYKDENHGSHTYCADSHDLYHWENSGCAIDGDPHEGPNVFFFEGSWWLIADYWRGQCVYRSDDCLSWIYAGMLLDAPGSRQDDQSNGNHADVLVIGDNAYIFYFAHPLRPEGWKRGMPLPMECKRTSIQVGRLHRQGDTLVCNRDEEYDFILPNGDDL
ncbi:MAG: glycosyl hydrolase [Christensenellales bacterium]|jgi:hypothetical protein